MVGRWGMSHAIGPVTVLPSDGQGPLLPGAAECRSRPSGLIDAEVRRIVDGRTREVVALLTREPRQARLARTRAARARDARPARRVRRRRARRRGRAGLMLAVAIAALAVATAKPAAAQHPIVSPWSPYGTKIAWVEGNACRHDVRAVNADGTKPDCSRPASTPQYQLAELPNATLRRELPCSALRTRRGAANRSSTELTFSSTRRATRSLTRPPNPARPAMGLVDVPSLATGKTWKIVPT